jgi:hypothetical protein
MKKIFLIILLFLTIIFSRSISAFEILSGEDIIVSNELSDDVYIAGGIVSVISPIWGDLFIVG